MIKILRQINTSAAINFGATHRLVLAWLPLDIDGGDIWDHDVARAAAFALNLW